MQTELLTLIFEEAKKQCESKNDSVGLGAMYSAIVSVGRDSHVLEGKPMIFRSMKRFGELLPGMNQKEQRCRL